jgi:hypothetical protein
MIANMFWSQSDLSKVEIMCINSFIANGYDVHLWTYGDVGNIPETVTKRDANEIFTKDKIFKTKGSVATFADLFRLKLLNTLGGLWVDADIIALKPENQLPPYPFLVSEDTWHGSHRPDLPYTITNNVIHNPLPLKGNVIDLAYHYAERFPKNKVVWAEIGPMLLHNIIDIYPQHGFKVYEPYFANSIKAGDVIQAFTSDTKINEYAYFLHFYNDIWRRENTDKNSIVAPIGSLLNTLFKTYL